LSVAAGSVASVARHTTFQLTADPSPEQARALARHVGAARFAFNQCLRLHLDARTQPHGDRGSAGAGDRVRVPWSGFDFINVFNAWKRSQAAGRRFLIGSDGGAVVEVTGLAWRGEVSAQVFEEAAVDLGKALRAWTDSRKGKRAGRKVGHPRFKKKTDRGSFRMRNKTAKGRASIRVGEGHPRSVTLPGIGVVRVRDDTRRLRRMLACGRARILFAAVSRRAGRWKISLNVGATDLHPATRHLPREMGDHGGWAGADRGLHAPVVVATADGVQTVHVTIAPKAAKTAQPTTRRLSKAVSRKKKGSKNRKKAVARLGRHHEKIRNRRQHFLHQVSNLLVKTHDRLVLEDLNVPGMLTNHRLAAAISDAAWGELARQISYKLTWRGGTVLVADRWFPSSKTCSACGSVKTTLTLAERAFVCDECGLALDRDLNAAINLAAWGEKNYSQAPDPEARGRVTNAHRRDGSGPRARAGETSPDDVGTGYAPAA
jgi:putative transposase